MTENETRQPTLNEIMEEIKKSRDDAMKEIESSRISMWLTPAVFGASIAIFGISYLARLTTSTWGIYSLGIPIFVIGLAFMVWARRMAKKAEGRFRAKWNEPPRN